MKKPGQMIIYEKKSVSNFLESKSQVLYEYIRDKNSDFVLYFKYLNHSDLPTFGKATKKDSHDDNLLYYLKTDEMLNIEKNSSKPFETAHQSNISLPKSFWNDLGMIDPRETVNNPNYEKRINAHADVFLVNDGLEFFSRKYTEKVFQKLNKNIGDRRKSKWQRENIDINIGDDKFKAINLTQAVHGIGIKEDTDFHKLRHHMFKNDILILLIEKVTTKNNLFILPVKNPLFYSIIGEFNQAWLKYEYKENERIIAEAKLSEVDFKDSYDRRHQDKWRNLLAEEMMNYTTTDYEVFCPFTLIQTRFDQLGTVFRASHIKGFKDCDEYEKYDLNNGLLLIANADALFDKHLITVSEEREIVFSFLIEHDHLLKSRLMLNNQIFKDVLNEKRMEYLDFHRRKFKEKEQERKTNNNNYFIA